MKDVGHTEVKLYVNASWDKHYLKKLAKNEFKMFFIVFKNSNKWNKYNMTTQLYRGL